MIIVKRVLIDSTEAAATKDGSTFLEDQSSTDPCSRSALILSVIL